MKKVRTPEPVIAALMSVLDEEHAEAVVDHRRVLRKPLSVRAAELLAKQFARCADPNEGADEMIMRGWQGFKPEWVRDRSMVSRTNYADAARRIVHGSESLFGGGGDVQCLPGRTGRH